MVTGANIDGFHLRGVDVRRDMLAFGARLAELRTVQAGDPCARCGAPLEVDRALELGHIFKLGTRYSEPLGATVLNQEGTPTPLVMGSYGIGIGRLLAAAVEVSHDAHGIVWPLAIAPFAATVLTLGPEAELAHTAEGAVKALVAAGCDVLYDDRPDRAGVKFNDADLIGIPLRIGVGQRGLRQGAVEWKPRSAADVQLVPIDRIQEHAAEWLGLRRAAQQAAPAARPAGEY
jgi:prolyl-tRNA synthetase